MTDSWLNDDAYEQYVGRWSVKIAALFLDWLNPDSGVNWIDIGCGTGALCEQIFHRAAPAALLGVDPVAAFLAAARRRLTAENVDYRLGSGDALPAPDRAFEFAVSGLALNFMPDQAAALGEFRRVLKPGGVAACYVWDYAGHAQFIRYFWDAAVALNPQAREQDEGIRFPECRPEPLRALFEAAGFLEVQVAPIDIPTPFPNFAAYWAPFLTGTGPAPGYCAGLESEEREALKEQLRARTPRDADGLILMAARAWAVSGICP